MFGARHPRILAGICFGAAGMLITAFWFGRLLLEKPDYPGMIQLILVPAACAAAMGALIGAPILDPAGTKTPVAAAMRGLVTLIAAFILYGPLYAAMMPLVEPRGTWSIPGLTLMAWGFGFVLIGWTLLPLGAAVGWLLYRWAGRSAGPGRRP